MSGLLVFLGIWCALIFAFGFGWVLGQAAAMGAHADELAERWSK